MSKNEPNLKVKYNGIKKEIFDEFAYKSVMQIPKVEKVVLSVGCGEALQNKKLLESVFKRN